MESWSHFHLSFWNETTLERIFKEVGFILRSKERRGLITREAAEYFQALTGKRFIKWSMAFLRNTRLDRLGHIGTLFYVLGKAAH